MTNKNTPKNVQKIISASALESIKLAMSGGRKKLGISYDDGCFLAGFLVGKRYAETGSLYAKDDEPEKGASPSFSKCEVCGGYKVSPSELADMKQGRDFRLDDFCPFVKGEAHPKQLKNFGREEVE